jgi:hypothetical protein
MPGPSFSNEKHHGDGLANTSHWLFAPIEFGHRLVDALRSISADGSALYVEGQLLSAALREELSSIADWNGTAIPAGVGWPEDWYFTYRLRRPLEALDMLANHAQTVPPSLVDRLWLFRDRVPLWEWQRDRRELLLTADLSPERVKRAALALERTPVRRTPAA